MKRCVTRAPWPLLALAPLLLGWSFFDPFHRHVEQGNRKAAGGDPAAAVSDYDEAAKVDPSSPIPDFNKGVALAEKGDADAARDALLAAAAAKDPQIASDALYNLGNVYMGKKEYGPAVDSYLKSLDLDPKDPDARRNLEIALQQQQMQQQQQKNQNQDQDKNQKQDEDKDDKDDKEQQKEPQSQPPDPGDKPKPDESQQDQPTPEPAPGDSTQAPPEKFSRDDAERLLNAIQGDELKVLDQMRQKNPEPGPPGNDW